MNQYYLVKHWLFTLLLAPVLPTVYKLVFKPVSGEVVSLIEAYPIALVFSFFLSLPTLLVYIFVFTLLNKKHSHPILAKSILISLTVAGITTTILLMGGSLSKTLIFAYSLAAIITGCIFRIKNKPGSENLLPNV